ncbi:MAG: C1 family peptidase [Candidatus Sericytochromatia bacterium]
MKLLKSKVILSLITIFTTACSNIDTSTDLNNFTNIESVSKSKFKKNGVIKSKNSIPLEKIDDSTQAQIELFKKVVDLRKYSSKPTNQGELSSCTGFAIVRGAREFLLLKNKKQPYVQLSPLFLYYNERKKEGTLDRDNGALIETGVKLLKEQGVVEESNWPYIESKFKDIPPEFLYPRAKKYKVSKVTQLKNLNQIKKSLDAQNPVVLGVLIFDNFFKVKKDGLVKMPTPEQLENPDKLDSNGETISGWHAITCIGYNDIKKVLIMKNSWGTDWGDNGYFYLPYTYIRPDLTMDAWSIEE